MSQNQTEMLRGKEVLSDSSRCAIQMKDWPLYCGLHYCHDGEHRGMMTAADCDRIGDHPDVTYQWPLMLITKFRDGKEVG